MTQFDKLVIIGGGGFGTALAAVTARAGRDTSLWARDQDLVNAINQRRENPKYLPGAALPDSLKASTDISIAKTADALLLAVPAQFMRGVLQQLSQHLQAGAPLLVCAKGIEAGSLMLMHRLVMELAPDNPVAVLSGPSFAADIARGLPTAVSLACDDAGIARQLAELIGTKSFRPYVSSDLVGVEIGGAIKNVIAIACGIAEGRGLGDSARAALMTRGLAEMTRLALALGGKAQTMMGLAGIGDLALSCHSRQSRNFSFGLRLGQGEALADIMRESRGVIEGASTAGACVQLAARNSVEMPISAAVDQILNGGSMIDATIQELLARPFTSEAV